MIKRAVRFGEASISEERGAIVPHAGIWPVGQLDDMRELSQATGCSTAMTFSNFQIALKEGAIMKKNLMITICVFVLAACQSAAPSPTSTPQSTDTPIPTSTATATPKPTNTPIPPTPTETVFNFSLPASACWVTSEVSVLTGQTVSITASGIVNTWGGNEISNGDPNGQSANMCGAIECPLQGANYGALIGRLEDLQPFLVGTKFEFTTTKDGELYFTVNDWECSDNSGHFDIVVEVN